MLNQPDQFLKKRISLNIDLSQVQSKEDREALATLLLDTDYREYVFEQLFHNDLRAPMSNHIWAANNMDIKVSPINSGMSRGAYLIDQDPFQYVIKITEKKAQDYNTLFHELINHISGVVLGKPRLMPIILSDERIASTGQYYSGSHYADPWREVVSKRSFSLITESPEEIKFGMACTIVKEAIDVWKKLDQRFIIDAHQAQFVVSSSDDYYLAHLIDRGFFRQEDCQIRLDLVKSELFPGFIVQTSEGDKLKNRDDYEKFFFINASIEQVSFPELITRLLENLDHEQWISDCDMGRRLVSSSKFDRKAVVFAILTHDLKLDNVVDIGKAYLAEYLEWAESHSARADNLLVDEIEQSSYL